MSECADIHRLTYEDKEITLVGTAHVSRESVELVGRIIEEERPETVCVELCPSRYQALSQKTQWQDTDLIKVIREKKAFVLLSNLLLSHFQKKIGKKLGVQPGEEMLRAVRSAESIGAIVHLADRDVRTTLSRTWHAMGLWKKLKLIFQLLLSAGETDAIEEKDIEAMKKQDVLEMLLQELGESFPEMRQILIDERDRYLASKIRSAPGQRIVAVVGAGHVPGIKKYWHADIDTVSLDQLPPKVRFTGVFKWGVPILIIGLILFGFSYSGASTGKHMVTWWVAANGVLSGLGAAIALAHPLTILAAVVAAPLTSLNPAIAAGWVSGFVETLIGRPKVKDFERLPEDISSLKGFWKNKITRVLLVVVFTNLGSALGTFVAIPFMVRVFA